MLDFSAAIFDLDGTLLDSMGLWVKIDRDFLARRGFGVPDDYAASIRSLAFRDVARVTIEYFSLDETEDALMDEWTEMARREYAERIELKPGAEEYLLRLKKIGVRLATATSLIADLMEAALRRHGIYDLFDAHCRTDEVPRGKDAPDVFLLAASRLGVEPGRCVVFEDIIAAVRGAKAAGMTVCCIRDAASSSDEQALRREADLFIDDFRSAPLPRYPGKS